MFRRNLLTPSSVTKNKLNKKPVETRRRFPSASATSLLLDLLFIPEEGDAMFPLLVCEIHGFPSHKTTVVIEFSQVKRESFQANYFS
jgi:hypothetical protein